MQKEQNSPAVGPDSSEPKSATLVSRSLVGGLMMGLANLVPGISGGTMLLASGIYPRFIQAIAEVTVLKFRLRSLLVLGSVVIAAAMAILLLAGGVKNLVVEHRWVMYSLFIGLTFGGLPIVWKMAQPANKNVWTGAAVGFVVMTLVALAQVTKYGATGAGASNWVILFVAGLVGAAAMILPGISGGYMLLVMGQYVPILAGVDQFKEALMAMDIPAIFSVGLSLILPVGLGVVFGVVAISNLLRWLMKRYEKATLGVLLGLLLGAVIGIWPFQQPLQPKVGDTIKGVVVSEKTLGDIDVEDWDTRYFKPTGKQAAGALGLIVAGFVLTCVVARIGGDETAQDTAKGEG